MSPHLSFGFIRETLPREQRAPITPAGVEQLIGAGHSVLFQTGAGAGAGWDDDDYLAAGADAQMSPQEVCDSADVLVKIHAPNTQEVALLRPQSTLLGFLHLSNPAKMSLRQTIRDCQISAVAFELLEADDGSRPVLEPLSAIGGRVAIILATRHLLVSGGGLGRLMGGSPSVPPLEVVVIGAGAAGEAAARAAHLQGSRVTVLDRDPRPLARVSRRVPGVTTAIASGIYLNEAVSRADLIIGAAAVVGRPSPQILTRRHMRNMRPEAMFIDMSIDEGGCAETSRPTTPDDPVYEEEGVRHMCVPNLPAEVARTASHAFTNAVLPYLLDLGSLGILPAIHGNRDLQRGCVYRAGVLKNEIVAEVTGEPLNE